MSGRIGGTPEQMQQMGQQFKNEADQVEALVGRITGQLASTDWEGKAATDFRDQWNGQFKQAFTQVVAGLRACSTEVGKRAEMLTTAGT